jgi:hypothetical protein
VLNNEFKKFDATSKRKLTEKLAAVVNQEKLIAQSYM